MNTTTLSFLFLILISQTIFAQWFPQTSGTNKSIYSIFFIDPLNGWAVGEEGTIIHTTDGGSNWNPQISGTSNYFTSVFFVNESEGWAVGGNYSPFVGIIYHTINGGSDWNLQTDALPYALNSIYFETPSIGWVVGDANQILKTIDGGINWLNQFASGPYFQYNRALYFVNENIGWIVGGDPSNTYSKILKTIDGGNNWIEQIANTNNYFRAVHFISETTGWVAGNGGVLFKTTDGGSSWIEQISGTTDGLYSIDFVDNENGWIAAGSDGLILSTTDGGNNWLPQSIGMYVWISSVFFVSAQNGWAAGNNGNIFHTGNGGVTVVEEEMNDEIPAEYSLSQNYPNPFNPSTKIKYEIPEPVIASDARQSNVTLKVFDVLGREVTTLVNEQQKPGNYEIEFNGAELTSGVYFYRLKTKDFTSVKKMIYLE